MTDERNTVPMGTDTRAWVDQWAAAVGIDAPKFFTPIQATLEEFGVESEGAGDSHITPLGSWFAGDHAVGLAVREDGYLHMTMTLKVDRIAHGLGSILMLPDRDESEKRACSMAELALGLPAGSVKPKEGRPVYG